MTDGTDAHNMRIPPDWEAVRPPCGAQEIEPSEQSADEAGKPATIHADARQTAGAAANDAIKTRSHRIRICETIRSYATPNTRSSRWDFLEAFEHLQIDKPRELIAELRKLFPNESLSKIGLLESIHGELRLATWFDSDGPLYLQIREADNSLAVVESRDSTFPISHTALDYALMRKPPNAAREQAMLFVVDSNDSARVMNQLGLEFATGESLKDLNPSEVKKLFDGDRLSDENWKYRLLLLDFDFAALQNRPTRSVGDVIERLADAALVYGIDPTRRFRVYRPSANDFHMLERATTFKDPARICQILAGWAANAKGTPIKSWQKRSNTVDVSVSAARSALNLAINQPDYAIGRSKVLETLPAYRAALRRKVIENFYTLADAASDPFDQFALTVASNIAEELFDQDPSILAAEALLAGQASPSIRSYREAMIEKCLGHMAELRRIRRDLTSNR